MNGKFEMVAKTFQGLEDVLADELRALGADNVEPGKRMVSFCGNLEMLYRANMCCRTALRILKPIVSFEAKDADALYHKVKDYDWATLLTPESTFAIDTTAYSDEFRNSQFVTYRVKDGIMDWFRDTYSDGRRPRVRLDGADIMLNVHIAAHRVTISLDSSGESLHKRGWRTAQTEAPISEVLAAGIILMTGWRGQTPFVDPMCGSGTFAIEAAMIAAGINPGVYRKHFAFETWPDFDAELLEKVYNDDSNERQVTVPIIAADINARAIEIARANARSAGVEKYITFETKPVEAWTEAPQPAGVLVTNPPYGRRISADDMNALYKEIGRKLKHVFLGYNCWIIGYDDVYFHEIGLAPSQKIAVNNGGLDCELRQYLIFEGKKADFRAGGGAIKEKRQDAPKHRDKPRKFDKNRPDGKNRDDRPSRRDDRPSRRDDRPSYKRDDAAERENRRPEHRPLDLRRLGKKPGISADKEIVISRPSWRVRKKDRPASDGENKD